MPTTIPIAHPLISHEEIEAVSQVLASGMLAAGKQVGEFERAFAQHCRTHHAVATSSGTSALHAALLGLGIQRGDEVVVPSFSFFASASCISMCGARPVFVDVNRHSYCLDSQHVEESVTPKTKAIVGVHLFGHPFDVAPIQEICKHHNLFMIEDAAQAHGATYQGRPVGSFGDAACFSFYATKNICTGEGGMVTTASRELDAEVRSIINHGQEQKYLHTRLGYNYRMTDMAAALGLIQLRKLEQFNARRQQNAAYLSDALADTPLVLPETVGNVTHVYHQYVVQVPDESSLSRDAFSKLLLERGIGNAVHYPRCIHQQPYYNSPSQCPVSEQLCHQVISLPVHPAVTEAQLEYICRTIRSVM